MTKVTRALSQFLVTADYRIVANDLDDLPEVTKANLPNCTWGKVRVFKCFDDYFLPFESYYC